MKRYTYFFHDTFITYLCIMGALIVLCLLLLPNVLSDIQFGELHSIWSYARLALFGICLALLAWLYRKLLTLEIIRYDATQQQFLRCVWQHTHWHTRQHYPQSQFAGIVAEAAYQSGAAQYGRVFLLGHNGTPNLEILHATPYNDRLDNIQSCYQKVAQVSQLPMLGYNITDTPRQTIRPANPQHFQAALPKTITLTQVYSECISAIIWAIAAVWTNHFFTQRSDFPPFIEWPLDWFAQRNISASQIGWILGGLFGFFALSCSLKTTLFWRKRHQQQNTTPTTPIRDALATRQSGEFVLFSRNKNLFFSAIVCIIAFAIISVSVSKNIIGSIVVLISIAALAMMMVLPSWQAAFATRKLVYHAASDSFTVYTFTRTLTWQPENQYPVSQFIGIACENNNELWLIGANHGVDICLCYPNKMPYYTHEQLLAFVQKISRATGLPFVVRMDSASNKAA